MPSAGGGDDGFPGREREREKRGEGGEGERYEREGGNW